MRECGDALGGSLSQKLGSICAPALSVNSQLVHSTWLANLRFSRPHLPVLQVFFLLCLCGMRLTVRLWAVNVAIGLMNKILGITTFHRDEIGGNGNAADSYR